MCWQHDLDRGAVRVPKFAKAAFIEFMLDNGVVGFFEEPVTLKSGRRSHWYVNWRTVSGDAYLTDRLADFLIDFAADKGWNPDAFFGVPEGASKLGIVSTMKLAKASPDFAPGRFGLPMGRGRPKEHGDPADRLFLTQPRGRTVVVEDVTTTGGSLVEALGGLKQTDAHVVAAVGLTSRMMLRDDGSSVSDAVEAAGASYFAMSEASEFLPAAYGRLKPGREIGEAIEEEFAEYGEAPLELL